MTQSIPSTPVDAQGDAEALKKATLLAHELSLLATATKWNLNRDDHREASAAALRRLFHGLAKQLDIDLFIEAGANNAAASRQIKRRYPDIEVVAFEANPTIFAKHSDRAIQDGVDYRHCALSDKSGQITFNILQDEDGEPVVNGRSSILKRTKVGDDRRGFTEATVDAFTLDEIFADSPAERAVMWVDVEGASQMVLRGAHELLDRTCLLIIEVEELNWWGPEHWMRDQVVSYLYDHGLVPVARDFEYHHQYNIVFVRSEFLAEPSRIRWALTRFTSAAVGPNRTPAPAPAAAEPVQLSAKVRRRLVRALKTARALRAASRS